MDELIILIFKGIAKLLGAETTGGPAKRTPQPNPLQQLQQQLLQQHQKQQQLKQQLKQQQSRRGKGTVRPGRRPVPPAMPSPQPTVPQVIEPGPSLASAPRAVQATPAATISRATTNSANAAAIRGWLTPSVLQKQFILTEVLQPPLALREKR